MAKRLPLLAASSSFALACTLFAVGCGSNPSPLAVRNDALAGCSGAGTFLVGAGRSDITGPFVGSSTGYNNPGDQMSGLATHLYARAFVIESPCSGTRIAYVAAEQLHLYQSIDMGVIKRLQELGLGAYYNADNLVLSATHTHAAPSNHSWRTLYNAFNGVVGYDKINYQIVVNGIADAIAQAHESRKLATIRVAQGQVPGLAHNRSAPA